MSDPYTVLGIKPGASEADIKAAWRRLAQQYHPDRNQGSKAAEDKFKEIQAAYDLLKKAGYKPSSGTTGATAGQQMEGFSFSAAEIEALDSIIRHTGAVPNVYSRMHALQLCIESGALWAERMASNASAKMCYTERGLFGRTFTYNVHDFAASYVSQLGTHGGTFVPLGALSDRGRATLPSLCRLARQPVTPAAQRHAAGMLIQLTAEMMSRHAKGGDVFLRVPTGDGNAILYRMPLWTWMTESLNAKASDWQKTSPHKRTWWRALMVIAGLKIKP
ncbi:MAG: DnaJ domain-containing protein [Proteobacteria bacterium]|nr:DnaJ domain-containing protein [Pseudomonadota bacterium]